MGALGRRVRRRGQAWYERRRADRIRALLAGSAVSVDGSSHVRIEARDLGLIGEGIAPEGFHRIARKIFYPKQWNREKALQAPIIDHMVNCEGVPESDVRDMRYLVWADALIVRTWNWRKFVVTGIHQHEHSLKHERNKK